MANVWLPIFLFGLAGASLAGGLLLLGFLLGPRRRNPVKEMPYESGMDPFHDARHRFDVRFYALAVAFLVFDVEILFLYPWAVASRQAEGVDRAVSLGLVGGRGIVFGGAMLFLSLVVLGFVYDWRKGVFRWR